MEIFYNELDFIAVPWKLSSSVTTSRLQLIVVYVTLEQSSEHEMARSAVMYHIKKKKNFTLEYNNNTGTVE